MSTVTPAAPGQSAMPDDHGMRGTWSEVWLIAMREVSTRMRSKAYRITTIALVLIVVAMALIFKFAQGGGSDTAGTIGYTADNAAVAQKLVDAGETVGVTYALTTEADEAAGESAVRSGDLDAFLTGTGANLRVIVEKDTPSELQATIDILARQIALDAQITELGGDPATVHATVSQASIPIDPLEAPSPFEAQQLVLGMVAGILIYLALLFTGQAVAQGVVEEKSSRVVEILLSTVRPWQLMAGKVVGIGIIGLLQMVVVGAAGVIAGLATGSLTIAISTAVGTVVWLAVWFLLGFVMYALVFAALAALVSRQEDVGAVVTPATMVVVVGYVIGISILPADPENTFAGIMSLIPFFAPTLMPFRIAMGVVPVWEMVLSVALTVAVIPFLVWLSARIYRNAVMRTGARVQLRDALRAL